MKLFILLAFIFSNFALAADCGVSGTVADRMKNCNETRVDAYQTTWSLVSRITSPSNGSSYSVWFDPDSNNLWTQVFVSSQVYANSVCLPKSASVITGNLGGDWKIASVEDYHYLYDSQALKSILKLEGPAWMWLDQRHRILLLPSGSIKESGESALNVVCLRKL